MTGHLHAVAAPAPVREHDMPVAWDGLPVTWAEKATPVGAVFICPPPARREACTACGQLAVDGADSYTGKVPGEPVPTTWTRGGRGQTVRHPGYVPLVARLVLTRCLGCGHDQVHDLATDETWDLDDTDYGPEGSHRPATGDDPPTEPPAEPPELAPAPPAAADTFGARRIPGPAATCDDCDAPIVWAITVAGPNGRGGKSMPIDRLEAPHGNTAVIPHHGGRVLARVLGKDEVVDRPVEYCGVPHFATCSARARGGRW